MVLLCRVGVFHSMLGASLATAQHLFEASVSGEHIPVPESKLKKLLHPSKMGKEGLVLPRHMMEEAREHSAARGIFEVQGVSQ